MDIGQVIGLIIKKKRLTQKDFAKRVGISTTALSQIINSKYKPSSETLDKICKELGVPAPIIHFLTISEVDIPSDKRELYNLLAPSLKRFIVDIFGKEMSEYSNQSL